MKSITIVIPSLKFGGGAEKVASVIGNALEEKGYKIHWITFYHDKESYGARGDFNCFNEKVQTNYFSKIYKLFARSYKIAKYNKINEIEYCIAFMEDANFSSILSLLFYRKSKIIVSIHHSIKAYGLSLYHFLIKILYRFAQHIVTLTNQEKVNLITNYGINKNKITVIYNPLNFEAIESQKRKTLGDDAVFYKKNIFTFVTIGRLTHIKNQELLIKTFIEFNKEICNTQLLIIGEGELKSKLIGIASSNSNIHFLGRRENVFPILLNSNCFILTSQTEAFSIAITEAMISGLPVISTRTQGGEELLSSTPYEGGYLIDNNSKEQLYTTMKQCHQANKKYDSKRIAPLFKIDSILEQWGEILN